MEDVTDTVFRRVVASCARPDAFFTEFTSVDGLFSRGREEVIHRFDFDETEHPIIAQVWGKTPELFYKAAQLIRELKFDGMDINIGCPERNVVKHGCGAKLIGERSVVNEIIAASKEGLGDIPLSIKTRLGYKKISEDWIPFLLEQHVDALTIHGRTADEMSKVPAHWDEIGKAVMLRNEMKSHTIIIGNGDVSNYADAVAKTKKFGVDGVMIGRGIFHDLWAFDTHGISHMDDPKKLREVLRMHLTLFEKTWGPRKNFAVMKKFFKIYINGFPNAGDLREELMQTNSIQEVENILADA